MCNMKYSYSWSCVTRRIIYRWTTTTAMQRGWWNLAGKIYRYASCRKRKNQSELGVLHGNCCLAIGRGGGAGIERNGFEGKSILFSLGWYSVDDRKACFNKTAHWDKTVWPWHGWVIDRYVWHNKHKGISVTILRFSTHENVSHVFCRTHGRLHE